MRQNEIQELKKLESTNYENIFNVYQTENGLYFYNLMQTVVFPSNLPLGMFNKYGVKPGDTWPNISYNVFNTPNAWWIILLANGIQDPTNQPEPGTILLIPKEQTVKEILRQIKA